MKHDIEYDADHMPDQESLVTKIMVSLLVLLVLACLVFYGIIVQDASWVNAASGHVAENKQETDAFRDNLSNWLNANGFLLTKDPGGMTSSAGMHSPNEINKWYKGIYKNSPPILLRVAILSRSNGMTQFDFSHAWSVRGTRNYINSMRSLSDEFAKEFKKSLLNGRK
jgi:hypothetical protein